MGFQIAQSAQANMIVPNLTFVLTLLATLTSRALSGVRNEFGQDQIDQILGSLKQDPNDLLASIVPQLKQLELVPELKIKECYDDTLDDVKVDIFRQPVGDIVHKYLNHFRSNIDSREINSRTQILLANIHKLAGWVLECALNTEPNYKPIKLGLTQMSIYTSKDFVSFEDLSVTNVNNCTFNDEDFDIAIKIENFDWRDKGIVSHVKDKGECASGHIFSAVATMESAYMRKTNKTGIRFSEQALMDCGNKSGIIPHPCETGFVVDVFNFSIHNGLALEDKYPYTGKVGDCKQYEIVASPTGYCLAEYVDHYYLRTYVYKYGPVAIGVAGDSDKFRSLKGPWTGTQKDCGIKPTVAVTVVGWNEEYFIMKNQWGTSWGVNGYLYLPKYADTHDGMCGIYNSHVRAPFF